MPKPSSPIDELKDAPHMVRWFHPLLLLDTARQAIASKLFGLYADRRLIHAALDAISEEECKVRYNYSTAILPDTDGDVWVDYVADLGDGFDSTYAIAYLLAQESLEIDRTLTLPRGQLLVMGGDQVYPTATRENYKRRLERPYDDAFPNSATDGVIHPRVFLLPGNHDWYDGLVLFLAKFCRGQATALGNWRAEQHRSYFAIELPNNCWIWGIDTQLTQDIDQPQDSYFRAVAKSMQPNARVILCTGVPSWLKMESDPGEFYMGLDHVASIARKYCTGVRFPVVLSGDTHHYSRYSDERSGTQFIVSGGGGAFLHPTHHLHDTVLLKWNGEHATLSVKTTPSGKHEPSTTAACYPTQDESRKLLLGNLKFVFRNPEFCLTLGVLYWLVCLLLMIRHSTLFEKLSRSDAYFSTSLLNYLYGIVVSPEFLVIAVAFAAIFYLYADFRGKLKKAAFGFPHAIAQLFVVLLTASLVPLVNIQVLGVTPSTLESFLITAVECTVIAGLLGGFFWGVYLLWACRSKKRHFNHAFSALRLDSFRHFLRLRIGRESIVVYPVGLDKTPRREDWAVNANQGEPNRSPSRYIPKVPMKIRLVEGPIVAGNDRQ